MLDDDILRNVRIVVGYDNVFYRDLGDVRIGSLHGIGGLMPQPLDETKVGRRRVAATDRNHRCVRRNRHAYRRLRCPSGRGISSSGASMRTSGGTVAATSESIAAVIGIDAVTIVGTVRRSVRIPPRRGGQSPLAA
jgi:hypothetical protein